MAFPAIPTGGRILTTTQADTSQTRTFPNLSSLTKNSGDLLIAIIAAYQSSIAANTVWSLWGGGFTEFVDLSATNNMAIGAAYKFSDGTETGTFTVREGATVTGHAAMTLMSIPGAHLTAPPEGGSYANGTSSAADPANFTPSWGSKDVLWIAVAGSGETGTGGTFTGLSASPTNYGSDTISSISADAVGGCQVGVGFRQLTAASEDVGAWSLDTSNARNAAVLIAVRPLDPTQTSVARLSLQSGTTPVTQTNHSIKIRARVTSGSGTIRAALYEGANNRSGDLESGALSSSLANYTLSISDVNAATITDYSDLEVRLWGYAANGGSIVFEVDQVYLETPEGTVATKAVFPYLDRRNRRHSQFRR